MKSIVPLNFKPGIKRDSTPFDSDYCIDGSWTRFYNGRPETIGGMRSVVPRYLPPSLYSDILVVPTSNNKAFVYLPYSTGIKKLLFNLDPFSFVSVVSENIAPPFGARDNLRWQGISLTRPLDNKTYVAFLGTTDYADINDNSAPLFFYGLNEDISDKLTSLDLDPLMNGGMCYAAPYLFLYGSNGAIRHSKSNDPFDFTVNESDPASGGSYTAPVGDKVVYARAIRGAANASPTLLLWTLSSVVRMSNSGEDRANFSVDTIAKGVSILSSRCVVEYEGLFFWPGTDRFFVYNGVVERLKNSINRKFFFDNLALQRRQSVFGVKNPGFGEIWWTWSKHGNSWALIYNNNENSWYDTAFAYRSAGTYYEAGGLLLTLGLPMVGNFDDTNDLSLWQHEALIGQLWLPNGQSRYVLDAIASYISCPYFSVASIDKNNSGSKGGSERFVYLSRLFPDFIYKKFTGRASSSNAQTEPQVTLTVSTIKYPQSIPATSAASYVFGSKDEKVDTREQGRYMSLKFATNHYFQMGSVMIELSPGDGQ